MGRGDDAHVDVDGPGAAHTLEAALLEHAQHLRLGLGRHVADLVEEDGAAVGRLEAALRRASAPVKAPFSWPKSSLSTSSRLMAAQFTATKGGCLRAAVVERLGHQLLAGAALAPDQHAEVRLRDLLDGLEDPAHGRARADQLLEAVLALDLLEQQRFSRCRRVRSRARCTTSAHLVVVEGLGDVVLGAGLHGLDGDLLGAVGGDHHHQRSRPQLLGALQHVHAASAAPQGQVREHQVEAARRSASPGAADSPSRHGSTS